MLGKGRFHYESHISIDAGEAPPFRPGRRDRGAVATTEGTRSPRSVRTDEFVAKDGNSSGGKEFKNEGAEEIPRRCSRSTSGSFEEGSMCLEYYDGDELSDTTERHKHHEAATAAEARLYAAAVLTRSFRLDDSDIDDDAVAWVACQTWTDDEAKPLSSSAVWRRPSRRNNANATRKPLFSFVSTSLCGFVLLVIFAVAAFIGSVKSGNANIASHVLGSGGNGQDVEMSPEFLETVEWLSENGISSMNALTTAYAPQYEAARWIAEEDHREIPESLDQESEFVQRYVLAVFYFALGGDDWTTNLGFLSENHHCAWYNTEAANDGETFAVGVTCNAQLNVVDIFITGNNLKGEIPPEIQSLKYLQLLSLRNNYVANVPAELAQLASTLEYLDLSKNSIIGTTLPEFLGSMQKLKVLGLAENAFSGTVPSQFSELFNLVTLDLGYNQMLLGGIKDVIGQMVKLEYLYLEGNQFGDTVDDSFFINLRSLKELALNDNQFKSVGELPFHLISHPNLTLLDLSNNLGLSGSLPNTFLSSSNANNKLKFLSLSSNSLSGTIPESIQMLSNLEYLDLEDNTFSGGIPVALGNLQKLKHCYLGSNSFDPGTIPPVFFTDMNLQVLSLPLSRLTGQIPPWFELLSGLTFLDLTQNAITGSIPDGLWTLPNLGTLLLGSNMLAATMPDSLPDTLLEIVDLGNNDGISGDASGLCSSSKLLSTFSYEGLCDKIQCTDPFCCHLECCAASASGQCFSNLISSALDSKTGEVFIGYQANRTVSSFNPSLIRHNHND